MLRAPPKLNEMRGYPAVHGSIQNTLVVVVNYPQVTTLLSDEAHGDESKFREDIYKDQGQDQNLPAECLICKISA